MMSSYLSHCCMVCFLLLVTILSVSAQNSTNASVVVQGGGATLPMSLYMEAIFAYRFVRPDVNIQFAPSTTSQAFCRIMDPAKACDPSDVAQPRNLDFAAAVSILGNEYTQYPDLQLYPTVASAVAPIFNLNGVTQLILAPGTLAKIWTGRIVKWDHPEIKATNPNFTTWGIPANQSITLVVRGDKVGTTEVFKKALAAVDPVFKAQIGTSSEAKWTNVTVNKEDGLQRVISRVSRTLYSMGYAVIGDAMMNRVPMCKLIRQGVVVEATPTSLQYAVLELGMNFGNNKDDPSHLTADIFNAQGPNAWPIASYTYIGIRKSTLRPGATCEIVREMMAFWIWFWQSDNINVIARQLGFSPLPEVVRDFVTDRFMHDVTCEGAQVWKTDEPIVLQGSGPESAIPIFDKFHQSYGLVVPNASVQYTPLDAFEVDQLLDKEAFVVTTTLPSVLNGHSLLFAGVGVAIISLFNITLDGITLAKILNGDIKYWLDPAIQQLNPDGIRDRTGKLVTNANQTIVLLQGPTCRSTTVEAMLRKYYPGYSGTAIKAAEAFAEEVLVRSAVVGTPYSFSLTAFVGQIPEELQLIKFKGDFGQPQLPSLRAIQACASNDAYDENTKTFTLQESQAPNCYPLAHVLYLSVRHSKCQMDIDQMRMMTLSFVEWIFSGPALDAALQQQNVVPLREVTAAVKAANDAALEHLSCRVPVADNTKKLLLCIILPIGASFVLGVGICGIFLWRATRKNRALRQQFSNDNVAEKCAEAIARFDLASVEWLNTVQKPNKIQRSFIAIIALLTEVKPFIPDQLLAHLSQGPTEMSDKEPEKQLLPRQSRYSEQLEVMSQSSCTSQSHSMAAESGTMTELPLTGVSQERKTSKSRTILVSSNVRTSLGNNRHGSVMNDWVHKRCTYMFIRFGIHDLEYDGTLEVMVEITSKIVGIAKSYGATIDKVTVDSVAVHWGVAAASAGMAMQAIQAGLEMKDICVAISSQHHDAFWLNIGVGKGICDCGTMSAAGHRFFVIWGAEASLAVTVVNQGLPTQTQCAMLISDAVYQEVQFNVECMPRMWFGEVLLWEPLRVLTSTEADEWMYELKQMDIGSPRALSSKQMRDVFLMVKAGRSSSDIVQQIGFFKEKFSIALTMQDHLSLDLLASTVCVSPKGR